MQRRNLVIVRAGDKSLHEAWLPAPGAPRSWDLVVNYFGSDPDRWRRDEVTRIDSAGPKWPALKALLESGQVDWRAYDRIWLPDDDLACTPEAIETLFALAGRHDFALCQPALSHDSYISHAITAHHPGFTLRRTNFVEAMAPLFTRALLERALPIFAENSSGWGQDYLWQAFLDRPRRDAGIVDAAQVRHTRPVGGANYDALRAQGKSPFDEWKALRRKWCLLDLGHLAWSALTIEGTEVSLDDEIGATLIFGRSLQVIGPRFSGAQERDDALAAYLRASEPLRRLAQQPQAA